MTSRSAHRATLRTLLERLAPNGQVPANVRIDDRVPDYSGGIWPFIGGMWVRFIHRLGLYDVACRERVKLAQPNRLGRNQEWEFNEWIHSRTGRPLGKCFEAGSAASFIHACQEPRLNPEELPHD